MNGAVSLLFENFLTYMNKFFESEFMQYILGMFIALIVIGLFRRLLRVNK